MKKLTTWVLVLFVCAVASTMIWIDHSNAAEKSLQTTDINKATSKLIRKEGDIQKLTGGGTEHQQASAFNCSTENGLCICVGGPESEDCTEMAEKSCKTDERGDVDLSCNGTTCSCEWKLSGLPSGVGGTTQQTTTQTSH